MLKTHYYGGIKKYQWVNIPLSMHGIIVKPNGEKIGGFWHDSEKSCQKPQTLK